MLSFSFRLKGFLFLLQGSPSEQVCTCALCGLPTIQEDRITLTEKGCKSLNKASKKRQDHIRVKSGYFVHAKFRKDYTHPHYIAKRKLDLKDKSPSPEKKKKSLRSNQIFIPQKQCLFCSHSTEPWKNKKKIETNPSENGFF